MRVSDTSILILPKQLSSFNISPINTFSPGINNRCFPLVSNVRRDLVPLHCTHMKSCVDFDSKLSKNGRLEDVLVMAQSMDASLLSSFLNIKIASKGISRLLRDGKVYEALEIFGKIQELGISPASLLNGSTKHLLKMECMKLVTDGKLDEFVTLMKVLTGYGFIIKDFIGPSKILRICIEKRDPSTAVRYASILPDAEFWFSFIIKGFGKKQDLVSSLTAFEESKRKPRSINMYAFRNIIDICGICGDFLKSRLIFEDLISKKVVPNTYVFNSLMNVNAHDLNYIFNIYKIMQSMGVSPDIASYNILLKACCLAGRVDLATNIYNEVKQVASTGSLKLDVITYSTIIKVFADAKMWEMALRIKEDMLSSGVLPNVITWSSLITSCARVGLIENAIQIFEDMLLSGCEPNTQCCNILLYACVVSCQYDRAFRFFYSWKEFGFRKICHNLRFGGCQISYTMTNDMHASENSMVPGTDCTSEPHTSSFIDTIPFKPTVATYNILMKACGTDYYRARSLMDEMRMEGLSPNHISWSTLIDVCGLSLDVRGAMHTLRTMRETGIIPDVVAYTAAIKVCVGNKNLGMAFSLYEEMKKHQLKPNLVTYNTLLKASRRYGSLHHVRQCFVVYQDMRRAGYSANDDFLKELIEEWCEGIIDSNQRIDSMDSVYFSDISSGIYHSLLLDKNAANLPKDMTDGLTIDIRRMSKLEARINILIVLRTIKEGYNSGCSINDDLTILSRPDNDYDVQNEVIKVLQNELDMQVVIEDQNTRNDLQEIGTEKNVGQTKKNIQLKEFQPSARRPTDLRRLRVTRQSLHQWLHKGLVDKELKQFRTP